MHPAMSLKVRVAFKKPRSFFGDQLEAVTVCPAPHNRTTSVRCDFDFVAILVPQLRLLIVEVQNTVPQDYPVLNPFVFLVFFLEDIFV